jgi:hypothetical protein
MPGPEFKPQYHQKKKKMNESIMADGRERRLKCHSLIGMVVSIRQKIVMDLDDGDRCTL